MQLQLILAEMLKPEVPNDEFVFLTDEDAQRLVGLFDSKCATSNMTRSAPTAAEFDGTKANLSREPTSLSTSESRSVGRTGIWLTFLSARR